MTLSPGANVQPRVGSFVPKARSNCYRQQDLLRWASSPAPHRGVAGCLSSNTRHHDRTMDYLAACEPAAESLSTNLTTVPLCTIPARSSASQLVRRVHPCDSVLPIFSGSGEPWMPYEGAVRSIQTRP